MIQNKKYEFVKLGLNDGILSVELNRPDVHNAFNDIMIAEITDAFVKMKVEKDVVPVREVREMLKVFSQLMRDTCRRAERLWGPDGRELYEMTLDSMVLNFRRLTGRENDEIVFCIEKDGKLIPVDMDT